MTRVILGDIAISQTGPFGSQLHEEDYVSEGTPIVTVEHLGDTNFTHQNLPFVSEADTKRLSKYILIEGDIVFSRVGSIDRNVYVDKNHEGWMFSGRCIRVRADKNKVNPRYLSYYFKQNSFKKMMMNLAVGATMPSLNTKIMNSIELDLLPRENQDKIANILSAIDDKIQINNQINQELEAMAKTLYDYWFVQFDFPDQNGKPYKSSGGKMVYHPELKREIPVGWGVEKLKDKLSVSRGISYKTENIKDNIGTPMINLASIDINRKYKSTGLKYFNGDYLKEKIVSGGDLLIACTDLTRNADIVGSPIIVPFDEQNYVFSMDLAKIDSKVDYINKYYLYSTLRTEHYHNYIKNWASGTNVLHLNIDGINWYSISIPPVELQEEYSKIILNSSKKTNKNIQENQQLTQLRDWLLPMLMNGQVKVQ